VNLLPVAGGRVPGGQHLPADRTLELGQLVQLV
jgi:hypothetical protein